MKESEARNKLMKGYAKYYPVSKIAKMFGLTFERTRQIINPPELLYCKKHKRKYDKYCSYCHVLEFYPLLLENNHLDEEIRLLKGKVRISKEQAYQKALLIRYLKDKKRKSFSEIGRIFGNDHTTIIYFYNKKL